MKLALQRLVPIGLGVVLLGGCQPKPKEPKQDRPPNVKVEPEVEPAPAIKPEPVAALPDELRAQLTALGDRGAYLLLVRDVGWSDGAGKLVELFAGPGASSPEWIWRQLANEIRLPIGAAPLDGRDPSRAMLASLAEAPVDGVVTAATALQPIRGDKLDGLRHQLLIPAKDMAALGDSVAAWFAEHEKWPELVAGREGAQAWRIEDGFVAALPEADAIRLVVVHLADGLDPSRDLARWQAQLDNVAVAPVETPALRQFGQPDNTVAALIRPWRLRGLSVWFGLADGRRALVDAPADFRAEVFARATQIVLSSELMMLDDNPELDDWALTLSASDGTLRMRAVASLTELGQRVLAAGQAKAPAPLTVVATEVLENAWISVDTSAMLAAAPGPSDLGVETDEMLDMWLNCGPWCPLHSAMRMPVGQLAGMLEAEGPAPLKLLLRQAHVTGMHYVELAPSPEGRSRQALAILLRPGDDVKVELVSGLLRGAFDLDWEVNAASRGETPILLIASEGTDPRAVFDLAASPVASAALAEGHVALANWSRAELPGLETVSTRSISGGAALAFELVVGGPERLSFAPDFSDMRWASPQRAAQPSPGDECLIRAGVGVQRTLRAWADADTLRDQLRAEALEQLEPDLSCAAEHEATAAAAAGLRQMLQALK